MTDIEHSTPLFVYCPPTTAHRPPCFVIGTANANPPVMNQLRERGIYVAPNGESFVASRERKTTSDGKRILSRLGNRLSCFLFSRYEWAFHGAPAYEVACTGRLLALKDPANFRPDQLIDTGATAGAH